MANITVNTTTMGFRVGVSRRGVIMGTGVTIGEFVRRFEHFQWDSKENKSKLVNEYFHYDHDHDMCYFPRYALEDFKLFLLAKGVPYEIKELPPVEGKQVEFYMLPWVDYKNDKQKGAVEFLTNPASGPIRGLALQTGVGKTVSYIWALQKIGRRSITTMTSRLEQWIPEMTKYTTLEEEDIYLVKGVNSLTKLFNQIDKEIFPKAILASTQTIQRYMEYGPGYQHLPPPSEMCKALDVGIFGTDEYHEHFHTNFKIGITQNPTIFIPITATFVANDPYVRTVFNQFIPQNIQFVGGAYDKFVNVTAYRYEFGHHLIRPFHYTSRQGYSQVKFEQFLLSKKGQNVLENMIKYAILPIIRRHYMDVAEKGEKFLFLCATKDLADHLETVFRREFNSKTTSVFYSGMPTTILEKYDIIISTPGSAGTGRDIKGLRTCFVFDNTGSEIRNLQYLGRLRGPPQMLNTPEFVYIYSPVIPQHSKYAMSRALLYGERGLTFKHRSIG